MSICPFCQKLKEDSATESCTFKEILVNGIWHKRRFVSFGGESLKDRCRECGIIIGPGHYHHYGCKNEECPECYRRIISCECEKIMLRNENGDVQVVENKPKG